MSISNAVIVASVQRWMCCAESGRQIEDFFRFRSRNTRLELYRGPAPHHAQRSVGVGWRFVMQLVFRDTRWEVWLGMRAGRRLGTGVEI
jgi:hypothetical protein